MKKDNKKEPAELNELEELRKKGEEYLAGWKRALADYDNVLKDLGRIKSELRQNSKQDVVESLLPVLDNFDQATSHVPDRLDDQTQNWLNGILHIKDQLTGTLSDFGAEPYGSPGDEFDPHLHDAIQEVNEPDQADQTIIQVTLRGWKMGEKIIRPAKVVINNLK
ncbi:nucleotide exchange factor GrpE [Patescibacteria group bacterium]|nr:nucleotide exchange factor GrpE [Patescibacteria group bacterium]MBU1705930.1 nucleotide exchange factor GrpE [Patescibacteria group bacterium]